MAREVDRILKLEVPIIVRLGEKLMPVRDVVAMMPGTILELPKASDSELELLVNNKVVGTGAAVKVGENFGLRINFIGDVQARIAALGRTTTNAGTTVSDEQVAALLSAE